MHPAHRTIGVFGDRAELRPYYRSEPLFLPESTNVEPMRVILVADDQDADACASMASFQRRIERQNDMECRCVDWAAMLFGLEHVQDTDCVVVFRQGVHMVHPRAASQNLDRYRGVSQNFAAAHKTERVLVKISEPSPKHPILEGMHSFESHQNLTFDAAVPDDATVLLVAHANNEVRPVAWLEEDSYGQAFYTTLGAPEDFRQPDFVRFVLNALAWIGR
jgi:hypothetical protein